MLVASGWLCWLGFRWVLVCGFGLVLVFWFGVVMLYVFWGDFVCGGFSIMVALLALGWDWILYLVVLMDVLVLVV